MVCSLFMLMLKFKMMDELDFICMPWLLRNQEIRGIVFYSRHIFSLIFLHCIPGFSTQVTHWRTKREILCDELHITLRQRAFTLFSFFKINVAFLNQYQVNDNQKTTHTQMTGPQSLPVILPNRRVSWWIIYCAVENYHKSSSHMFIDFMSK